MVNSKFEDGVNSLIQHIKQMIVDHNVTMYSDVRAQYGRRYTKILKCDLNGNPECIWGFVDSNGDVLRAATYNAPAKHARGSIYDQSTWTRFSWTGPQYL